MTQEKLFKVGNADRGDNLKKLRVVENASKGTGGRGEALLVHSVGRLIPRSISVHIEPCTQLGHFTLLSRT